VRCHEQRARHAGIVGDEPKEHERGAHGGFAQHEDQRRGRGTPCRVARRPESARPEEQDHDADQRETAGQTMRELDERGRLRLPRDDFAVTQRPVAAAPGATP
jgi:hypothetical protein